MKKALLIAALIVAPSMAHADDPKMAGFPCGTLGETTMADDGTEILACLKKSVTDAALRWKATTVAAGYVVGQTSTPAGINSTHHSAFLRCYGQVTADGKPQLRLALSNYDTGWITGERLGVSPMKFTSNGVPIGAAFCSSTISGVTATLTGYSAKEVNDGTGNPDVPNLSTFGIWQ